MKKTVLLMRHGEAGSAMRDFDRPLTDEGIAQCKARALILQQHGVMYSAIVSSPAARARSSAVTVAAVMGYSEDKIIVVDGLYNASEDTILEVIQNFDDSWHTVLLVGHNPGLSFLATTLCPQVQGNLDVGELYAISFSLSHWSDVRASKGELILY